MIFESQFRLMASIIISEYQFPLCIPVLVRIAGQNLQKCTFPNPVVAYDANGLSAADLNTYILAPTLLPSYRPV